MPNRVLPETSTINQGEAMSKDPTRNIDRYKIRGGQMNPFEFHQNQGAVSEQQHEHGNWAGAPEDMSDLPPDKAKAERIRHLLAKHGESVPQADGTSTEEHPVEKRDREQAGRDSETAKDNDLMENAESPTRQTHKPKVRVPAQKTSKGKTSIAKSANAKKDEKPSTARKSVKQVATTAKRQSAKKTTLARSTKSTKKAATDSSEKQVTARKSQAEATARSSAETKTASARGKANGKASTQSATTKRTAAPKRAKASAGKSR